MVLIKKYSIGQFAKKINKNQQTEDLIQIITVFSCRLQGKRAKKTKAMIKELTDND